MSLIAIVITLGSVALIVGGIMLIKQSARKFILSEEQLKNIEIRKKEQQCKDDEEK